MVLDGVLKTWLTDSFLLLLISTPCVDMGEYPVYLFVNGTVTWSVWYSENLENNRIAFGFGLWRPGIPSLLQFRFTSIQEGFLQEIGMKAEVGHLPSLQAYSGVHSQQGKSISHLNRIFKKHIVHKTGREVNRRPQNNLKRA